MMFAYRKKRFYLSIFGRRFYRDMSDMTLGLDKDAVHIVATREQLSVRWGPVCFLRRWEEFFWGKSKTLLAIEPEVIEVVHDGAIYQLQRETEYRQYRWARKKAGECYCIRTIGGEIIPVVMAKGKVGMGPMETVQYYVQLGHYFRPAPDWIETMGPKLRLTYLF